MRSWYILLAIVMSALITFGLRALPFVLFRGGRSMPEWMQRLGQILPSAIMAVLIVYCLKGAKSNPIGIGIPGIIAVA
ncbi:MAG: AzlD domain-containing protein, partial [Butyrivibrio sp.]|nr:AzlD domain-containing protein [Butyrivibrio sp.]